MAFFTLVQGTVFVTSQTNLPSGTPIQILETGAQGPSGTAGKGQATNITAVSGTTTLSSSQNDACVLVAQGTPGGNFTWLVAATAGQFKFFYNNTANTLTVKTVGGAGIGTVTVAPSTSALFFTALVGSTIEAIKI